MLSVFLNYSFEESFKFNPQTSSMIAHFLLDVFTLCAVALLVFILIVTKVTKKRRQLQSIKTTGTQTSYIVPNLDASIFKISSELTSLQDRMEILEQNRLQTINSFRMGSTLHNPNEKVPAQTEDDPAQEKISWPGAHPLYPSY